MTVKINIVFIRIELVMFRRVRLKISNNYFVLFIFIDFYQWKSIKLNPYKTKKKKFDSNSIIMIMIVQ